ncbi:hypothetical protein [Algoriphagus litoralis]|uniref:hypothetical protein n=1 Tax=Algoriphagus litoralis TaxID=2202829 RepID=UPI001300A1D3|nr:hypothetical protein [Algoriphagus litoralis]
MIKLFQALLVLSFFASCTSSKIFTARTCMVCMQPDDGVLVLPLAWEPSFRQLSVTQKNQIERQILALLKNEGFQNVELLDRLDYELLRERIKDLNDPMQREKLSSKLGYSYLIGLTLGPTRVGETWGYQTPQEAYELAPVPDMEISSVLRMVLISTETGQIESDFIITSTNSGFSTRDKEGGMDYQNYAELFGVIQHGVTKGIKNLVKGCRC